jgi:hypothetical protein
MGCAGKGPQKSSNAGGAVCVAANHDNNPHFPALRADPLALSGASRRKQTPSRKRYPLTLFIFQSLPFSDLTAFTLTGPPQPPLPSKPGPRSAPRGAGAMIRLHPLTRRHNGVGK